MIKTLEDLKDNLNLQSSDKVENIDFRGVTGLSINKSLVIFEVRNAEAKQCPNSCTNDSSGISNKQETIVTSKDITVSNRLALAAERKLLRLFKLQKIRIPLIIIPMILIVMAFNGLHLIDITTSIFLIDDLIILGFYALAWISTIPALYYWYLCMWRKEYNNGNYDDIKGLQ